MNSKGMHRAGKERERERERESDRERERERQRERDARTETTRYTTRRRYIKMNKSVVISYQVYIVSSTMRVRSGNRALLCADKSKQHYVIQ